MNPSKFQSVGDDVKCNRLLVDILQVNDKIIDQSGAEITDLTSLAGVDIKKDIPTLAPIQGEGNAGEVLRVEIMTLKQCVQRIKALQDALAAAGIIKQ